MIRGRIVSLVRRGERQGVLVGACFCLVVLANQINIGSQMVLLSEESSRDLARSVIYWFAFVSVVVHVVLWTAYAALVTAAARVVFNEGSSGLRFHGCFQCVGLAHVPLIAWALSVALAWGIWQKPLDPADLYWLLSAYAATRVAGYLSGIGLMVLLLYGRHSTTMTAAVVVAAVPAAGLWLGLALMNGLVGVLSGVD